MAAPARKQIPLRLPHAMADSIDRARGSVSREEWIRVACALRLQSETGVVVATGGPPAGVTIVRGRLSAEVKRDVKPIPKGDKK